jgi:hypothetical protein
MPPASAHPSAATDDPFVDSDIRLSFPSSEMRIRRPSYAMSFSIPSLNHGWWSATEDFGEMPVWASGARQDRR